MYVGAWVCESESPLSRNHGTSPWHPPDLYETSLNLGKGTWLFSSPEIPTPIAPKDSRKSEFAVDKAITIHQNEMMG
jgi:hypothetical protein